ncbi:hypothetical protein LJC45_01095 [Alistipes sp. OttesenSCG-928-B03]|nr:hypothetical protein [Alistipes sp. OttesenSCG-928-B03]
MAKASYYITKATNSKGESEIRMRLYATRDNRIRVGTGIWVSRERWGKKNEINIPLIESEERNELIEKKKTLKRLTDHIETLIAKSLDKSCLDRKWAEREVRKFHRKPQEASPTPKSIFDFAEEYITTKKLSQSRRSHFKVVMRCMYRFEYYMQLTATKSFKLSFENLSYAIVAKFEDFIANEHDIYEAYPVIYEKFPYGQRGQKTGCSGKSRRTPGRRFAPK